MQQKSTPAAAPSSHLSSTTMSDNDSDTSSSFPAHPTSPILTPATPSVGGLSAIAERKTGAGEEFGDELELEDVEEEGAGGEEEEGSGSEVEGGAELERGMEGERMVKSGYLAKKQERRKVKVIAQHTGLSILMRSIYHRHGRRNGSSYGRRSWRTTRTTE